MVDVHFSAKQIEWHVHSSAKQIEWRVAHLHNLLNKRERRCRRVRPQPPLLILGLGDTVRMHPGVGRHGQNASWGWET
eukprot:972051-Prorocentrum_minimum.AAC.1